MGIPGIVQKRLRSFDGTEIAYQVRGRAGMPAVVFANGLGGRFEAFRHLYRQLGEDRQYVCWDYRGLYQSARPHDLATLGVHSHCRDLEAILAAEGVKKAIFIGWSMGVQVNFEFFRMHPDAFEGLVVLNGTYGRPFNTAMGSKATRFAIPVAIAMMKRQAKQISRIARATSRWRGMMPLLQRLGMIGPTMDGEVFADLAGEFLTLDFYVYGEMLRHLGEHDAEEVLPRITVPTLIITGDRDLFTPVFTAKRMNRAIHGSHLVIVPGGTHYTAVEHPEVVGREVGALVAQIDERVRAGVDAGAGAGARSSA
jgi:pimeloyl-ACP methyl ester carboxylesterase